ncbi:MAG: signal peptidase I, partial [Clostridia bacterium]|nr:signal peptidase I [Clostridia bacterium]
LNNSFNFKNKGITVLDTIVTVLMCIVLVLAVSRVVFSLMYFKVYVIGASMSGTIEGAAGENVSGGEYVYACRRNTPVRGDIIIIDTHKNVGTDTKNIIKRVIALGGDKVALKEGVLYLNGEIKEESYILPEHNTPSAPQNSFDEIEVPKGYMFCMGDNRNNSTDSRSQLYGCMPVSWTEGIVADWSLFLKKPITDFNTYFDFTLPKSFGVKK